MTPQPWTPPEADKQAWTPPVADAQAGADHSVRDHLKDEGFLDSAWNMIKSPFSMIGSMVSGDYGRDLAADKARMKELEKNGTTEQRREFAKEYLLKALPGASTVYKAVQGNIPGALGDLVGMVTLGAAAKGMAKGVDTAVEVAPRVAEVVKSPEFRSAAFEAVVPAKVAKAVRVGKAVYNAASPAEVAPPESLTPGQILAQQSGADWAKLSPSDQAILEHVAKAQAQANAAAQPPRPPMGPPQAPPEAPPVVQAPPPPPAGPMPQVQQPVAPGSGTPQPAGVLQFPSRTPAMGEQMPAPSGMPEVSKPPARVNGKAKPAPAWDGEGPASTEFPGYEPGGRMSKVQMVDIGQVQPTEASNPTQVARLVRQFQEDPSKIPAITTNFSWDGDGIDFLDVADGHNRLEAARQAGIKQVPVRVFVAPDDWAQVKSGGGLKIRGGTPEQVSEAFRKGTAPPEGASTTPAVETKAPTVSQGTQRGIEKTASNRTAKAQRFAQALHDNGISAADAVKIEAGHLGDSQIQAGMTPRWGNIAQLLGEDAPSALTMPQIIGELKKLETPANGPVEVPSKRAPGGGMGGMKNYFVEPEAPTKAPAPEAPVTPNKPKPFGEIYGDKEQPAFITPEGPVWMWRKGQKVRFMTAEGVQVGPEQANVSPAVFAAHAAGWIDVQLLRMRESPAPGPELVPAAEAKAPTLKRAGKSKAPKK